MKSWLSCVCRCFFVAGVAVFSAAALAGEYRSVNAATVLFDTPSQKGNKLFVIKRDTPVEVVVSLEGWSKVRDADGGLSWVEKTYLSEKRTVLVSASRAQIRQKAEEAAPLVFEAEKNVALEYLESVPGGWVKVRHPGGQSGFVRANQVWGI
ncbi:SH3 domain-containing protein [Propionivibrio limicola]|uniref:SH3 domain-containing protein n=1 Tax=Propionivibrio limicola TaxID=167645 RepID=UPI001290E1B6|nr:SH3 domain-containing protein [Propionivibrio limicola]